MSRPEFTITRTFDAPRELIWRAWTDPVLAAQWWHPHEVTTPADSVRIDLREGGSYEYLMIDPDGGRWPTAGEYLEVREPELLRFTWGSPDDPRGPDVPIISVRLSDAGADRCEMTFHLAGMHADPGADQGVYDGWTEAFEELADALASGI